MQNIIVAVEPIGRLPAYGSGHLLILALTAVLTVAVVPVCRQLRATGRDVAVTQIAGWVLLTVTIAWTGFWLLPQHYNVNESLPFHFSDALRFITAYALITRAGWAIMISYLWGLTLNAQSLVTPDLNYFAYPGLEFSLYWFLHIVNWLAPVALIWGLGYRPTWRGFFLAYLISAAWTGVAFMVNLITGANYAFTMSAPAGGSALDLLGPWPWYTLSVAVLLGVVWALMTWPWTTRHRTAGTQPHGAVRVTSST